MSCNCTTPCDCNPCEENAGCPINLDTSCVFYNLSGGVSGLNCLALGNGASLTDILESLDSKVCSVMPNINSFSLPCLRDKYVVTSIEQLYEAIDTELCSLSSYIGTTAGNLTTSINSLSGLVSSIYTPTVTNCGTVGLVAGDSIIVVLQKILNKLCALDSCCEDNSPNLTANSSSTILFTTTGTKNHILTGSVKLSSVSGNILETKSDGLYCSVSVPDYTQVLSFNTGTNTLSLSNGGGSVVLNTPSPQTLFFNCITNLLEISGGNSVDLSCIAGVALSESNLVANDSSSIDFTTSGTSGHTLTGSVKVSPDSGNIISIHSNGIYATSSDDVKVKLNSIDPTAGYLEDKIAGKANALITTTATSNNSSHKTEIEGVLDVAALLTTISGNPTLSAALCVMVKACVCLTFYIDNKGSSSYTFSYVDCSGITHSGVSLAAGSQVTITGRSVTPSSSYLNIQCFGLI